MTLVQSHALTPFVSISAFSLPATLGATPVVPPNPVSISSVIGFRGSSSSEGSGITFFFQRHAIPNRFGNDFIVFLCNVHAVFAARHIDLPFAGSGGWVRVQKPVPSADTTKGFGEQIRNGDRVLRESPIFVVLRQSYRRWCQ